MTVQREKMTLEQFLHLPEQKPYLEFIHGKVEQKAMPGAFHGILQAELATALVLWSRAGRKGRALTEQRCILKCGDCTEIVLPDVAWWSSAQLPDLQDGPLETPPTLAVEILSPEDRYGKVQDKIVTYLAAGVPIVWVVDPRSRNVTVFRPHSAPQVIAPPATLQDEALPELMVSLEELFSALDTPPKLQE